MSPRMSSTELAIWQMKHEPPKQAALIPTDDQREEELHDMIISWCRRQDPQIPFGHGSMAHKTRRTPGEPDFYILMPRGKLLMVECKTGEGVLSEDQKGFIAAADKVNHVVWVVRTYLEFLRVVQAMEETP